MSTQSTAPVIKSSKISNDLLMHILLVVFLGSFWLWPWVYKTTALLNNVKGLEFRKPSSKLALFILIPFYSIYWFRKTAKGIELAGKQARTTISFAGICTFLAFFVPSISSILIQMEIEKLSSCELSVQQEKDDSLPVAMEVPKTNDIRVKKVERSEPKKEVKVETVAKNDNIVYQSNNAEDLEQNELILPCPFCKETLYFVEVETGDKVQCPYCNKDFVV